MSVRVSYDDRTKVVTLFYKHKLNFEKGRFHILKNIAAKDDIFASEKTFRRIINHWKKTGCVSNKENLKQNKINIYQKKRFQTISNVFKRRKTFIKKKKEKKNEKRC
jgi:hypothetical protein